MHSWLALALLLPNAAVAQTIDISMNEKATSAGLDESQMETQLNSAIQDVLKLGDQNRHDQFVTSMAEAAAISAKGMGVDYASNIEKFVFGGAISSGVHEAGFAFKRGEAPLPVGGFAAQLSLMAGVNLGMGGKKHTALDRFRLYANGLVLKLPSNRSFGGQMANGGAHLQVKLIEGNRKAKLVEWGGLDLTSGFEVTGFGFDLRKTLPVDAPMGGGGGSMTWQGDGTYDINSTVMSVPVELSSNLRVAVATAYLGAAYDYNITSGTSNAVMDGPLSGRMQAADGSTVGGQLGSATVTASANGVGTPHLFRFFVGAQANVTVLKGFAHLNIEPLLDDAIAVGGHLGIRVAL